MTTVSWRRQLEHALTAPVEELVADNIRVTGSLEGSLGNITSLDEVALQTWGLPSTGTIDLRPTIKSTVSSHYVIGTSFELGTLGGCRLFVRPEHGRVLQVREEHGLSYSFVNSSIHQLIELAWRYHYVASVRQFLDDAWDELGVEPAIEANGLVWERFVAIDPLIDIDMAVSFWEARVQGLA